MGRSDYIVQAGIGFDLDRSSAKKSIGIFEGLAGTLNTVATKKAAEGFAKTEKKYAETVANLKKTNQKADADLIAGTTKSAKAAADALNKSMMKPPSQASSGAIKAAGGLKKYKEEYAKTVGAMKSSYAKFAKESEKIGIKFSKGSKISLEEFAKKDAETRKQAINLTKRMVKDEKERLKQLTKGSKGYDKLSKEIEALAKQEKHLVNLNEDIYQQERKTQKVKNTTAKKERKAEKTKIMAQKKILMGLKNLQQNTAKLGRLAQDSAGKIAGGFTNAFVIGTAAAAAFFYKMQPLAESVQEFEKTIINANSVFNVTKKELFEVSDSMVRFTLKYGVSAQDTATGLYQLASAGLDAAESQEVLQHTMKLAMATQGDHNTLAKLTVQTIMGFGMEMEQAGELTDKFAHTIQKSLVEWQDLASSVKFAMPFFTATGQSIEQLLGGIEVLSNRALEAGIAGRGLRQALAQFAKHADNNSSSLRKMGVEIMDAEGNMRALSEIAMDAKLAFGDVTDLEALTAMLEDMNVRGATAFALLVQNSGEYKAAVEDLSNSAGEATQMADIQQQSLANQIQLVKNALLAPFLFADEVGEANNTLNEFTFHIQTLVEQFTQFFIKDMPDGTQALTDHADAVKEFVIVALKEAVGIITQLKEIFLDTGEGMGAFTDLLVIALKPLKIMLNILDKLGPDFITLVIQFKILNSILPITNILTMIGTIAQMKWMASMIGSAKAADALTFAQYRGTLALKGNTTALAQGRLGYALYRMGLIETNIATGALQITTMGLMATMGAAVLVMGAAIAMTGPLSDGLGMLAGAMFTLAMMSALKNTLGVLPFPASLAAWTITAAVGAAAGYAIKNQAQSFFGMNQAGEGYTSRTKITDEDSYSTPIYDNGGTFLGGSRMYDNGGPTTEHGMAILQKGETVIPKTRNMLEGGITLNIGGDIVTDNAEDFAERIAQILPEALRRQSDIGGI
jgi:TP901 family phage tail tape measure protein